jgi:hypothetical protein
VTETHLGNRAFLIIAASLLLIGIPCAYHGIDRLIDAWYGQNDMHYFYNAAKVVADGRAEILYDQQARFEAGYGFEPNDQVFPYPVPIAYLLTPLTLTDLDTARYFFSAFSAVCLVLIAVAGWIWSRDWRFAVLVLLAVASSFAVYDTLRFQQVAPVLALMLCVSLLTTISSKSILGGVLSGLLVLKPSIAAVRLGLLTFRRGYQQIAAAALCAALIVFVVPFLVVGIGGLRDYFELLGRYRHESFTLDGHLTAGAGWMLGWQAIVGRLTQADPSPYVVIPMDVVTVLVMLRVWWRGRYIEGYFAAILTTVLVIPHVLWYDWVILLGVAPYAIYRNRTLPLLLLGIGLHAAVSFDTYLILTRPTYDAYPLPTPLLAGAVLLYLAFAPMGRGIRDETEATETHKSAAVVPSQ